MKGVRGVGLQLPRQARLRRIEGGPPWDLGPDDPDLRGVRASPSELQGPCWARTPAPVEVRSSRGCPCPARPAIAARSPRRPPGSARSSRSSCAGSSPASPSAPAAHSAWPRGSASCSCGSSCRVTSWFRDDPGAARFLPPVRPLPDPGGGGGVGTKTSFAPARRL